MLKIELKAKDLYKVPIIDSFASIPAPTKNDFNRLLSNYPFQIKEGHKIYLIYQFVVKEIERRGGSLTGQEIMWQIIDAVEEIQNERDVSLHSGASSAFLNDSEMYPSNQGGQGFRRKNPPTVHEVEEYNYSQYSGYDDKSQFSSRRLARN